MILDIEIKIKRHNKHVNDLECVLEEAMLGETMALRVIEKVNSRLMFNYRKKIVFLDVPVHRLLCNALIQTHFACTAWYSNLKVKNTLEVIQNKCIRFYLKLQCREDMNISNKHFQRLN